MTTNSNAGISPVDRRVRGLPRYICEHGLEGRLRYAVNGANTVQDLQAYLECDPHPEYRLVTCQHMRNGNWHLTWELMPSNAKSQATDAALSRQVACTDGFDITGHGETT